MSGLEAWMKSAETTHRFCTQEVTVTPLHCLLLRSGTMPHCKTLLGTTVSDGRIHRTAEVSEQGVHAVAYIGCPEVFIKFQQLPSFFLGHSILLISKKI